MHRRTTGGFRFPARPLAAIVGLAVAAAWSTAVTASNPQSESYRKPGVGTPIDLRGYVFADDFLVRWPTFPATSYDAAFGGIGGIDAFVLDQLKHIDSSVESGLYDGTEQWTETQVLPSGETQLLTITRIMTSKAGVYLPMRDGGYALLLFDAKTRAIDAKELYDSQGTALPVNGDAKQFLADRSLNFASGERGLRGIEALADWTQRTGIALLRTGMPTADAPYACRGAQAAAGALELRCDETPKPAPCKHAPCFATHSIWGLKD